MEEYKISVIVPVYKVEEYLNKCVDSIINQTYKNLEIILVDDGSPDSCGKICDEYAKKDNRIKVIHKENGGVSSARNIGLDVATGDYVGFVDSDDWIDIDMYELLIDISIKHNCDIARCTYRDYIDNRFKEIKNDGKEIILNSDEAIKLILEPKINRGVWTTLYKCKTIKNVRFSDKYKVCEDYIFNYYAMKQAEKIVIKNISKYVYVIRDKSLSNTYNGDNYILSINIAKEIYENEKNNKNLKFYALKSFTDECYLGISQVLKSKELKYFWKIREIMFKYSNKILLSKDFNFKSKFRYFIVLLFPHIYIYKKEGFVWKK